MGSFREMEFRLPKGNVEEGNRNAPRNLTLPELFRKISETGGTRPSTTYRYHFHRRLSLAASCLAFGLLAIPLGHSPRAPPNSPPARGGASLASQRGRVRDGMLVPLAIREPHDGSPRPVRAARRETMTIVTRYLLREFSRMAAGATAGFLLLFLVIDFVERADEFLKYKVSPWGMLGDYLYSAPNIFILTSPVAVLPAV